MGRWRLIQALVIKKRMGECRRSGKAVKNAALSMQMAACYVETIGVSVQVSVQCVDFAGVSLSISL
jgi:hypothetical protein